MVVTTRCSSRRWAGAAAGVAARCSPASSTIASAFYEDFLSAGVVLFFNAARAPVLSQVGYSDLSFVDGTT